MLLNSFDHEGRCVLFLGSALEHYKGIEVGQIFELGTKYSDISFLDQSKPSNPMIMVLLWYRVSRTLAAVLVISR